MSRSSRSLKCFIPLIAAVMLAVVTCSRENKIVGTYRPIPNSPPEYSDLYVELKKGGEGIRRVQNGEPLAFHWVVKGDEVRIHTKSGGTIVAKIKGDLIEVRFPGPQVVFFKKIN